MNTDTAMFLVPTVWSVPSYFSIWLEDSKVMHMLQLSGIFKDIASTVICINIYVCLYFRDQFIQVIFDIQSRWGYPGVCSSSFLL